MHPYISFVIPSRNDSHEGNFLHRLQYCIDTLVTAAERAGVPTELVLVDWNPPPDRAPLREEIKVPDDRQDSIVTHIEVPNKVHERIKNPGDMPMFQFCAKNVGIRRAAGDFIVGTNGDLVWSTELFEFLAGRPLEAGRYYRTNRYDVGEPLPPGLSLDEALAFCSDNVVEVATQHGRVRDHSFCQRVLHQARAAKRTLVSNRHEHTLGQQVRELSRILREFAFPRSVHEVHEHSPDQPTSTLDPTSHNELFNSACGDFLLMANEDWYRLRGYPELHKQVHVDTIGLAIASYVGLTQTIINNPMRIYHQTHPRATTRARPSVSDVVSRVDELLATRGDDVPIDYRNDDDWGLGDIDLPTETV